MPAEPLRSVDVRILEYLRDRPPEYVPLVANRLGVHLGYAEGRFDHLVERGLVRAVTNESTYTVTEAGRSAIAAEEEESEAERTEPLALADD
jgi:DNA-binding MarR family transcriptional regulator